MNIQTVRTKIGVITLLGLLTSSLSLAQHKQLSMEDAIFNSKLSPKNLKGIQWVDESIDYSYIYPQNGMDYLIRANVLNRKMPDTVLNASALKPGLKQLPSINWVNAKEFIYRLDNTLYRYNTETRSNVALITYPPKAANIELNPQYNMMAYTLDNQLYLKQNSTEINISKDSSLDILYGHAVHRNEFGINKGIFWSPNSTYIAYYRMDQSMVSDYPLVDINPLPAQLNTIKYPMAGQASHKVSIGVYNIKEGRNIYLAITGAKDQYLTNISWSKDEKYIYVVIVKRDYSEYAFNKYDAITGKFIQTLFSEQDARYVEPSDPAIPLSNGDFIWHSERDGYKHLYLYNANGKLLKQLTKGNWVVTAFLDMDEKEEMIYYMSTEGSPLERHAYSLNIKNGKKTKLTSTAGVHTVQLSGNKQYLIDRYSSTSIPNYIGIHTISGIEVRTLLEAENPVKEYALGETSIFTIKAADNQTDLYCRMIKPVGFDPSQKYPVVVYVYGGPHVQLINNSWLSGANLWYHYMAQRGYIVFTIDSRGSMYRGRAFEQAIYRNLGVAETEDQMKGIAYLKSQPYVDANRIGVHGWSYGGFMATTLMTKYPGVFKVGVAGGPVIDWAMYEVMYTERYMDSPEENTQGYKNANLLNSISQLKDKLLVIHGTIDDLVVWQHSLALLKKAVDEGVQLDYFVYPGHPHNVRGKDRVHLMNKVSMYFDDYLK